MAHMAAAYAAGGGMPYPMPYPPAPPPPSGLAAIPTPVWIIVIGGGVFVMFKSGVFGFLGSAFGAAGDVLGGAGKAGSDILGSAGGLGSKVIDNAGANIVDPLGKGLNTAISGIFNFGDALFSNDKKLFGGSSTVKVWPLSWIV